MALGELYHKELSHLLVQQQPFKLKSARSELLRSINLIVKLIERANFNGFHRHIKALAVLKPEHSVMSISRHDHTVTIRDLFFGGVLGVSLLVTVILYSLFYDHESQHSWHFHVSIIEAK